MARILVVEDDDTNAEVLERVLSRMGGHEVIVTEDATQVLARCRDGVGLVVMDVSLSNTHLDGRALDGVRLTRLIRRRTAAPPPVLLLTAHAMRGDRERLLQLSGADDYVSKPIMDHHEFLRTVEGLLSRAEGRAA